MPHLRDGIIVAKVETQAITPPVVVVACPFGLSSRRDLLLLLFVSVVILSAAKNPCI
jgi:hypothetical protein